MAPGGILSNWDYPWSASCYNYTPLPRIIQCLWPFHEIAPFKPDRVPVKILPKASGVWRSVRRVIFQPCWGHLRRNSITSKHRQVKN